MKTPSSVPRERMSPVIHPVKSLCGVLTTQAGNTLAPQDVEINEKPSHTACLILLCPDFPIPQK